MPHRHSQELIPGVTNLMGVNYGRNNLSNESEQNNISFTCNPNYESFTKKNEEYPRADNNFDMSIEQDSGANNNTPVYRKDIHAYEILLSNFDSSTACTGNLQPIEIPEGNNFMTTATSL